MGKHFSHLTPTQRTQIDAFRRAGMKVVDIAKEVGVHYTTIYRELKRCTYEHLNSDYTTEIRYNPDGAQARYEANLRAKGPELKIGNDYELADYLIGKIRDEKYSPEAAIGEAEVMGWPFRVHICASTAYNYIRAEIFGDDLTVEMLPQHGKRRRKPRLRQPFLGLHQPPEARAARGQHPPQAGRQEHRKAAGDRRHAHDLRALGDGQPRERQGLQADVAHADRAQDPPGDHRPHEGQDQRERRPGPQRHRAEAGRPVPPDLRDHHLRQRHRVR